MCCASGEDHNSFLSLLPLYASSHVLGSSCRRSFLMSFLYVRFANGTKGNPGCGWSGCRAIKVDVLRGSCFLPDRDTSNRRLLENQWSGFGGSRLVVSNGWGRPWPARQGKGKKTCRTALHWKLWKEMPLLELEHGCTLPPVDAVSVFLYFDVNRVNTFLL